MKSFLNDVANAFTHSTPNTSKESRNEVLIESFSDLGAVVLATFFLRKKFRKLGYSKEEVYVLSALFTSLFWTRLHLQGIRRELRRERLGQ